MLGVESYRGKPAPSDTLDTLDLRWTSDERDFLDIDLMDVLAVAQDEDRTSGFQRSMAYRVADPLGSEVMRLAISHFFDCEFEPANIWCGAGVASLLHDLAAAHARWDQFVVGRVYPDYPTWIDRLGGRCQSIAGEIIERSLQQPSQAGVVVYLERPMLLETSFDPLDAIDDLCAKVASCKGLVIIDESNGNYWPASYSAARLVKRFSNLIVLRGFSKAYGLGGLRCGIALVSRELQTRISNIATPLQVSSLSIDIARRVMLHGDATRGLRTQILVRKAQMLEALSVSVVGGLTASHGYLPYVFAANAADVGARQLGQCGILGKPQPLWGSIGGHGAPFRLSAPLRDDRFERFQTLLRLDRHALGGEDLQRVMTGP